jgi:hypothetical protein
MTCDLRTGARQNAIDIMHRRASAVARRFIFCTSASWRGAATIPVEDHPQRTPPKVVLSTRHAIQAWEVVDVCTFCRLSSRHNLELWKLLAQALAHGIDPPLLPSPFLAELEAAKWAVT